MRFRFFLSDQHGDIELSEDDLAQPFLTSPSERHPFLTLGDYFGALQQFITPNIATVLRAIQTPAYAAGDIDEIIIRSEKHGAFYHIASVSLSNLPDERRFAVTSALSGSARASLAEEIRILRQLAEMNHEFLPEMYCHDTVFRESVSGAAEFLMVLGEWLSGFHEWHAGRVPETGECRIQLWDYENGYRFLDDGDSFELLEQAAYILTCFYDQASYRQIYPWHHGAGDFIAKCGSGSISVRLITARQYEPLVGFDHYEEADSLVALIHFLLNLILRMRLDRLDGVYEPVWLGRYAVRAAIAGFFRGMAACRENNRPVAVPGEDFLALMQSFDGREILEMYSSLMEIYADEDQDDFNLIREKIAAHSEEIYRELQDFSL